MMWACFMGEKVGPLMIFDKRGVDDDEYMDMLLDELLSFVDDLGKSTEAGDIIAV